VNVGCPSCGATIEFRAGTSAVVVCPHCRYAIVRTDRDLRTIGKVADLAATSSSFRVGMRGRFRGVGFTIVGRQQLDHGQGPWDEWYAAFDDGRWGWIAEAQGRVYATFPVPPPQVPYGQVAVGGGVTIGNQSFVVAEKGLGRNVAAEGELPTGIHPGASSYYIDLSGPGGGFATLDYGRGEGWAPEEAYVGFVVTLHDLGLVEQAPAFSPHDVAQVKGKALTCPNCGGNLEIRAPGETRRIACPFCSALLDTSQGQLRWLEILQQQQTVPKIPIGARGHLLPLLAHHPGKDFSDVGRVAGGLNAEWTVIGFMTRGCRVEGVWYYWDEYLLYEPKHGFRFLLEQDGHWNLVAPLEVGDVHDTPFAAYFKGRSFQKFGDVQAYVVRVLGEFYWAVRLQEWADAKDFIAPDLGLMLSREYTRGDDGREEVQWSMGHYVEGADVFAAFGVKAPPPPKRNVGPNQPSPAKASARFIYLASAVLFALMLATCGGVTQTAHTKTLLAQKIDLPLPPPEKLEEPIVTEPGEAPPDPADVNTAAAWYSEPFDVAEKQPIDVSVSAMMDNSWLWVGGALVNEETGHVYEFEVEPSYYSGVEDGESWSEGSRDQSKGVAVVPAGRYVLRLQPAIDTPDNCHKAGTVCPTAFSVSVVGGKPVLWPGVFAFLFIALGPVIAFLRTKSFEAARWRESNVGQGGGSSFSSFTSSDDVD
jgi:DNA-directed RNA polymerase subunit RPC12/RpoP